MTNRFLISVAAAALIAGTGFANAQGTGTSREAPASGSAVQQSAPSGNSAAPSAAPMNRDSASDSKGSDSKAGGMKATQSDQKMPQGSTTQRAQDDMKAGTKTEKSAQDNMKGEKSKSTSSETEKSGAASKDMKAEGKSGNMNADSKGTADTKAGTTNTENRTTGNAATSATAAPPAEKRTQITTAFKSEKIEPVTNVNFNISVGATVPSTVRFHPIPSRIVEIYPEWRGYDVIFVNGRYVILRPRTHEIVYIIEG